MEIRHSFYAAVVLLVILPAGCMVEKASHQQGLISPQIAKSTWNVSFEMKIKGQQKSPYVKIYIPRGTERQKISGEMVKVGDFSFSKIEKGMDLRAYWKADRVKGRQKISYSFSCTNLPVLYELNPNILRPSSYSANIKPFLEPECNIQSNSKAVNSLANMIVPKTDSLIPQLRAIYKYVRGLPSHKSPELMTALDVIRQGKGSCNGKSRLMVALCRNRGIPARLVGGIILTEGQKRTSHQWLEVWIGSRWVPFDALNGYFASLPAHYLELYHGDHFLIARRGKMDFDFLFDIQKAPASALSYEESHGFNLMSIVGSSVISPTLLKLLLLFPLAAMVIAIFKNVIGLRTFGVFLPALIAISLTGGGILAGVLSLILTLAIVSGLHFLLDKWALLYTPKLVILLVAVIGLNILLISVSDDFSLLSSFSAFPIVIMAITAEKFARTIVEDGFGDALRIFFQTMVVTAACYFIFDSAFFMALFLTYPELDLAIVGIMLLLGRWIGLRLSEYQRFSWILT